MSHHNLPVFTIVDESLDQHPFAVFSVIEGLIGETQLRLQDTVEITNHDFYVVGYLGRFVAQSVDHVMISIWSSSSDVFPFHCHFFLVAPASNFQISSRQQLYRFLWLPTRDRNSQMFVSNFVFNWKGSLNLFHRIGSSGV